MKINKIEFYCMVLPTLVLILSAISVFIFANVSFSSIESQVNQCLLENKIIINEEISICKKNGHGDQFCSELATIVFCKVPREKMLDYANGGQK